MEGETGGKETRKKGSPSLGEIPVKVVFSSTPGLQGAAPSSHSGALLPHARRCTCDLEKAKTE